MTTLKAIDTEYAGHLFRSRLEARWAVFFDQLGIEWEYEPQGYEFNGHKYLPDFWLPGIGWYEVKGKEPTDEYLQMLDEFAAASGERVYIAVGPLNIPAQYNGFHSAIDHFHEVKDGISVLFGPGLDTEHFWCVCVNCGTYSIQYEARSFRIRCGCDHPAADRGHTGDHPRIVDAFKVAKAARFEHGSKGVVLTPTHPAVLDAASREYVFDSNNGLGGYAVREAIRNLSWHHILHAAEWELIESGYQDSAIESYQYDLWKNPATEEPWTFKTFSHRGDGLLSDEAARLWFFPPEPDSRFCRNRALDKAEFVAWMWFDGDFAACDAHFVDLRNKKRAE